MQRATETWLALLLVLSAAYLLLVPLAGKQYAPGDDIFFMVLFVGSWLAGLALALGVLLRRGWSWYTSRQ